MCSTATSRSVIFVCSRCSRLTRTRPRKAERNPRWSFSELCLWSWDWSPAFPSWRPLASSCWWWERSCGSWAPRIAPSAVASTTTDGGSPYWRMPPRLLGGRGRSPNLPHTPLMNLTRREPCDGLDRQAEEQEGRDEGRSQGAAWQGD